MKLGSELSAEVQRNEQLHQELASLKAAIEAQ
jgi:hypothetical protein